MSSINKIFYDRYLKKFFKLRGGVAIPKKPVGVGPHYRRYNIALALYSWFFLGHKKSVRSHHGTCIDILPSPHQTSNRDRVRIHSLLANRRGSRNGDYAYKRMSASH